MPSRLLVALAGLAIQYALLRFGFRQILGQAVIQRPDTPPRTLDRRLLILTLAVLGLVFCGFVAGLSLAWTAMAGGALIMVLARRDTHQVLVNSAFSGFRGTRLNAGAPDDFVSYAITNLTAGYYRVSVGADAGVHPGRN